MRFWDTSAIIPLLLDEPYSVEVVSLLNADPHTVLWWGTPVECWSAVWRRIRDGSLAPEELPRIEADVERLVDTAIEVNPRTEIRDRARRLLARHALRAADSLQLSAALFWGEEIGAPLDFVCLDRRLRGAAMLEGLLPVPGL